MGLIATMSKTAFLINWKLSKESLNELIIFCVELKFFGKTQFQKNGWQICCSGVKSKKNDKFVQFIK